MRSGHIHLRLRLQQIADRSLGNIPVDFCLEPVMVNEQVDACSKRFSMGVI